MAVKETDIHEIHEEGFDRGEGERITKRTYRYMGVGDYPLKDFAFVYEDEDGELIFRGIQSRTHWATWDFERPGYVIGRSEYRGMEQFIPTIPRRAGLVEDRVIKDPDEIRRNVERDQLMTFSLNGWLLPPERGTSVYFEPIDPEAIYPRPGFEMLSAYIVPKARRLRLHFTLHDGYEAVAYTAVPTSEGGGWGSELETDRIQISHNGRVIQYLGPQFWNLAKWLNWSGKTQKQVLIEARAVIERNWIRRALDVDDGDGEGEGLSL